MPRLNVSLLRQIFFGMAAFALCLGTASAAAVRQFSPVGQIDQPQRANTVFNADMVPLGRPDAPPPFNVDCGEIRGKGRWVDVRIWSYVLDRPLQPGERCDFRLKPGLKAANGEVVSGEASYAFFAPGPWPRSLMPRPGAAIEEDQAFLIDASIRLKRESVERNVWCEADGVGHRIPIRLLPDASRNEMLATQHAQVQEGSLAIQCSERLPTGVKMRLVWGPGVEVENSGKAGAKSSRTASFLYVVREPFRASVSCEREKPNTPCSPLSDLTIEFSVPVDAKQAAGVRLITPDGVRAPKGSDDEGARENTVRNLVFKRPFAQNVDLKIELPVGLKDEAGRVLDGAEDPKQAVAAGQCGQLPAHDAYRHAAASGEVSRCLWYRRTEGRRGASGNAA